MEPINYNYKGAINNLSKIMQQETFHKPLIFCGKKSFENIKPIIEKELKPVWGGGI